MFLQNESASEANKIYRFSKYVKSSSKGDK